MPCHPLMCCRAADCSDRHCPGHPHGAAAHLEEVGRQSLAHHAAMHKRLPAAGGYWPRDSAGPPVPQFHWGWPEWGAIAFFLSVIVYALARITGVFE